MTKPSYLVNLSLLSNGLDFINCGLSELKEFEKDSDNVRVKYAILHIHAGVELLLKERLRREHWCLVFENEPSKSQYEKGDFQSVGMKKCIERLKNICNIDLSDGSDDRFNDLRILRNGIEHYSASYNVMHFSNKIANALSSMIDFVNNHLSPEDFQPTDKRLFDEIKDKLNDLSLYIEQRVKDIQSRLAESKTESVICPSCKQKTAIIDNGLTCLLCEYKISDPENAADEYLSEVVGLSEYQCVKDGDMWPVYECPYCEANAFIMADGENVCFSCGKKVDTEDLGCCTECGQPYICRHEADIDLCENCISYKLSKDD